jgi:hypothetical protein
MSGFFSGSFDPSWPHAVLLTIAIVSSFAVAIGIVMESPHWSIANVLVVGGVAIEAVCTILLFGFDEGISNAQQAKIISLEEQIAPRTLSKEQVSVFSKLRGKYPAINVASEYGNLEASFFAFQIAAALGDSDITVRIYDAQSGAAWSGYTVLLDSTVSSSAEPLLTIMSEAKLVSGIGSGPAWDSFVPTAPHNIPLILVGEKYMKGGGRPYFGAPKAAASPGEKK